MAEKDPNFSLASGLVEDFCIALKEAFQRSGGPKSAAFELGREPSLLYRWANPNDAVFPPALACVAIDRHLVEDLGQEPVIAASLLKVLGYSVQKIECTKEEAPVPACIHALGSCGAFTATVADALEDGKVTPKEAQTLKKQIDSQMTALEALRRSLADVRG